MTTPMMKQWQAAKALHGDGLLFFRMGDFFEFFHEDARTAARVLGLTLTSRSKGEGAVAMAGIPVKSVDGYVKRLVDSGHKCVICDQVEDPSVASGLVDRRVTRIVTPGTLTEDDALDSRTNNHLVACGAGRHGAALSWVDVSTGQFATKTVERERLADEILALDAAEILLPESASADLIPKGCELAITRRPDSCFDHDDAIRRLTKHFRTRSLAGFGIDPDATSLGAAGAILDYLEETQQGAVGQIRSIRVVDDGHTMILDRATRSSLELVRRIADGQRAGTLLDTIDRTRTAMGARLLRQWVLAPLRDPAAIRCRQDGVAAFVDSPSTHDALRRQLREVLDIERLAARVGCGRATPRDLAGLRQSLARLPEIRATLADVSASLLEELADALPDLRELESLLARALVDEPPPTIKDGGVIRDGYHAELDELRGIGRRGKGFIDDYRQRESEATGIPNLKVGYNRVFGYYIEVTNTHRDRVPDHYHRKQTLKNAERFVTPELKEYEDKILGAEERILKLESELFLEVRKAAEERLDELQQAAAVIASLDCLQSHAQTAREGGWVRPEIDDSDVLDIREGCHPVLAREMGGSLFVPNDTTLDASVRFMLITGPNMAGKSTYIRQTALIVLLAQMGSWIPARSGRIGVVDRVFTRVGASDDIARGASTFMVEMLEVANILNNATDRSLVILDEVGRGTSTYDGLSIAWAITEHLAGRTRCRTLFATHYHELTAIAESFSTVRNHNVAVREYGDEITFLHKIVEGATDRSYGIHVARLAGLPVEVVAEAGNILARLESQSNHHLGDATAAAAAGDDIQLALFAPRVTDPVVERLRAIDPNSLTPIQSLSILAELVAAAHDSADDEDRAVHPVSGPAPRRAKGPPNRKR